MPLKRAARAFLWRFGTASSKIAYGRYGNKEAGPSGQNGYTKNYLQVPRELRDALNPLLGHDGAVGGDVSFWWRWPGGEAERRYSIKDSGRDHRGELYVTQGSTRETKELLPPFAPGPSTDPLTALDGDPNLPTPDDANGLLAAIEASGQKPWFMAVALEGETGVLHARMVLEDPPPGKEGFALSRQPLVIQEAVAAATGEPSLMVELDSPPRAWDVVARIEDAFARSPNVLLVGPPGCGKSVALEDMRALYEDAVWFDPDRIDPWTQGARKVYETAFHPGISYQSFVAGLAPAPGSGIALEVRTGPLIDMAQWCRGESREGLLVIDEFNRGPAAAIFGDAMVLLDKAKRQTEAGKGITIVRPHADREMKVPEAFSAGGAAGQDVPGAFSLPANLRILGAFNSSDRSVAALDAALLRRFAIVRVDPDPVVLAVHLGLKGFDAADTSYQSKPPATWTPEDIRRLAMHLFIVLNERLRDLLGEDHTLGHALLWEVSTEGSADEIARSLAAEFEEKIVGRLRLTLRDKDEELAAILGVTEKASGAGTASAGVAEWSDENTRIGRLVGPKLRILNLKDEPFEKQITRLLTVLEDAP